jgi:hypothetical protein
MALYEEVCAACQQDRMIAIDYSPAEPSCAHYPGSPEQVDWGDTLLWCDCDETGEELDAMVKRYRHKAEDAYARGYDDL